MLDTECYVKVEGLKLFLATDNTHGSTARYVFQHVCKTQELSMVGRKQLAASTHNIIIVSAAQISESAC